jgi:hypothetical protein
VDAGEASAEPPTPQGLTPRFDSDEPFDASKCKVGITAPLGFWDPIGLSKEREGRDGFRWKSEKEFYQLQEAEIKHGRVAMMATVGILFASYKPAEGFESVPAGLGVLSPERPEAASLGIFFIVIWWCELCWWDRSKEPGNKGDSWGFLDLGCEYSVDMRNYEINHGRLAMSGILTTFLTEYLSGMGPREQLESVGPQFIVAIVGFLIIVQKTPKYSDQEIKRIKANMDMSSLGKLAPAGSSAR